MPVPQSMRADPGQKPGGTVTPARWRPPYARKARLRRTYQCPPTRHSYMARPSPVVPVVHVWPLFRLIQRRVDPLDSRLDLAPVAGAPGAFQYLAHVQKRAE